MPRKSQRNPKDSSPPSSPKSSPPKSKDKKSKRSPPKKSHYGPKPGPSRIRATRAPLCLETMPPEIVVRIIMKLLEYREPNGLKDFYNACLSCPLLCLAGRALIGSPCWNKERPRAFNFYLPLEAYKGSLCRRHLDCCHWHGSCELSACPDSGSDRLITPPPGSHAKQFEALTINDFFRASENELDEPECYYHRIFTMMTTKHLPFSGLRFKEAILTEIDCLSAFKDCFGAFRRRAEDNMVALVELDFQMSDISLDWLWHCVSNLTHLLYIRFHNCTFTNYRLKFNPSKRLLRRRNLEVLSFTSDRTYKLNDQVFTFFVSHMPAYKLDMTGTRIAFSSNITDRFYRPSESSTPPSDNIFTFRYLLDYLVTQHKSVRMLVMDETDIEQTCLQQLLDHILLNKLHISVRKCPLIPEAAKMTLLNEDSRRAKPRIKF